jgi:exosortase A
VSVRDKNVVLVLAVLCAPLAIYWQSMVTMSMQWSTETYRHGYLVPFASLFLLWRERRRFSDPIAGGSWIGVALLALLVGLWIVARTTSVQTVEQLSVVMMVSALALAVFGFTTYKALWFPLAFLLFAVPVGDSAVPYLMDSTATIAVAGLQMFGIPALREGMIVSLPGGTFEVVEACSGYNYLNAGIALGVLVGHLMFRLPWKRLLYIGGVVAAFVLLNGVRAFVIMAVGSTSNMHLLVSKDHVYFGWALFVVSMCAMYWVAERYSDVRELEPPRAAE